MERKERNGVRVRHGKPVAVAVSGLAVVGAVLVSTVLSTGDPGSQDGAGGGNGGGGDTRSAVHGGQQAAREAARQGSQQGSRQGSPALRPGASPEPEKCDDGSNPAASLKPSGADGKKIKSIKSAGKDKDGKLVVGVDQNSYLWGYRDPASGDLEGFDIDLVRAIAKDILGDRSDKEIDKKITYKTIPTDQRIPAIEQGDVDMVVRTMTISCDRLKEVAFSTAYFEAGQQLLVPKKKARVTGFNDSMRGKRVCFASGSTAETMMTKDEDYKSLGAEPVVVANQLDCLVRLQLGEADATVTDNALAAGQAAQDPSVHLIGDEPETLEPYGVAMNLKDKDLVRRVNKVLNTFRKDQWQASYDHWLDAELGKKDADKAEPPKPEYRD